MQGIFGYFPTELHSTEGKGRQKQTQRNTFSVEAVKFAFWLHGSKQFRTMCPFRCEWLWVDPQTVQRVTVQGQLEGKKNFQILLCCWKSLAWMAFCYLHLGTSICFTVLLISLVCLLVLSCFFKFYSLLPFFFLSPSSLAFKLV